MKLKWRTFFKKYQLRIIDYLRSEYLISVFCFLDNVISFLLKKDEKIWKVKLILRILLKNCKYERRERDRRNKLIT